MPPASTLPQNVAQPPVNPLDEAPKTEEQILNEKQIQYYDYLTKRLKNAQEVRDRQWPEFSNKTYLQHYQENEKISNTYLEPKQNPDDVQISTGTIESKLNVLLSHIDNLNLTPEIRAFDKFDIPLHDLGMAFTDILDRVAEHDGGIDGGDAEKRMLRQKDLIKQGTVFVQDKWCTKRQAKKTLTKKYDGSFNFDAWETAWKPVYEGPDRVLLYGPNVYLGDITVFSMDEQPFVFTSEIMSHDIGKTLFGSFENWTKVVSGPPPASVSDATTGGRTIYDNKWRLSPLVDGQIEVIKYQDPIRDEFQIIINGIMMLPIGFPLSAVSQGGKINIAKQVLYPINPQFAYGKSFVSSGDVYELSKIIDEIIRLFVLKTRKSITPPYINTSGKIISRRVLSPGNISQGIPPNALQPIGQESQGVTQGEYQIYNELLNRIDHSTIGPAFQGQQSAPGTTATEIVNVQRQAKLALGTIISACTFLEMKLAYLRLPIIIANYFEPIKELDGDGKESKRYRQISRETQIPDDGMGQRMIIPIEGELPDEEQVRLLEIQDEKDKGYPVQRIYLSPEKIRKAQITWRCVVVPKEKESTATDKLAFRETLNDALALIKLGSKPNTQGLEAEFARVYQVDKNRYFAGAADLMSPMAQDPDAAQLAGDRQAGNMPNPPGVPTHSEMSGAASP